VRCYNYLGTRARRKSRKILFNLLRDLWFHQREGQVVCEPLGDGGDGGYICAEGRCVIEGWVRFRRDGHSAINWPSLKLVYKALNSSHQSSTSSFSEFVEITCAYIWHCFSARNVFLRKVHRVKLDSCYSLGFGDNGERSDRLMPMRLVAKSKNTM
jgi:hypothetical protein